MSTVKTPFIEEEDEEDKSRGPISLVEDGFQCPMCNGVYLQSTFKTVKKGTANQRPKKDVKGAGMTTYMEEPDAEPEPGRLKSIAAKVLMKLFYAARLARFDLLRAIANLARYVT